MYTGSSLAGLGMDTERSGDCRGVVTPVVRVVLKLTLSTFFILVPGAYAAGPVCVKETIYGSCSGIMQLLVIGLVVGGVGGWKRTFTCASCFYPVGWGALGRGRRGDVCDIRVPLLYYNISLYSKTHDEVGRSRQGLCRCYY